MRQILFHLLRTALALAIAVSLGSCTGYASSVSSDDDGSLAADSVGVLAEVMIGDAPSEPDSLHFASLRELRSFLASSPERDNYAQGIIGDIAGVSLRYAERLLNSPYEYFIVVDKQRMKVILFDRNGREVRSYGMACAKNYGTKHKKGDSRTPEGFFKVKGVYNSTDWLFTDDEGRTSQKKGQYGPKFIRLDIPGITQIGIHGTCAPWSIGGRSSHGCIRIKNENILELASMVKKGMPVIVSPGKRDMAVNREEGYDIPAIPTTGHHVATVSLPGDSELAMTETGAGDEVAGTPERTADGGSTDTSRVGESSDSTSAEQPVVVDSE